MNPVEILTQAAPQDEILHSAGSREQAAMYAYHQNCDA
jgi:hypothetical protein